MRRNRGSAISRRSLLGGTTALASVLLAGGPAGAGTPAIPKLPQLTKVKVGSVRGSLTNAGVLVAAEKGYFRDSNLDIEFVPFAGIMDMVPVSATGQLDVGTCSPGAAFFNAVARGVNLRLVADCFTARPGFGSVNLMLRKDLADQIKSFADLKGRTIALGARSSVHEVMLAEALKRGGLTLADARVMVVPFPEMNVAFANKAIDAGIQIEPLVANAVATDVAVRWYGIDQILPNVVNTVFMFSEGFAARKDVAQAWVVAYLRGVRDYYDAIIMNKGGREEIIDLIAKYMTVKNRSAYAGVVFPGVDPNGAVNVASIQETLGFFRSIGAVKAEINLGPLVDQSFVQNASNLLGRYAT